MSNTAEKFIDFLKIVARLRAPDGCLWDKKQTPQTFKTYLIEEAHELLEAIDTEAPDHIREELGDLLFQIVFLNNLYEEKNLFTMKDVIETISAKMVRRHPHVFGNEKIFSEKELRKKWHAIKSDENAEKERPTSLLESIPKTLPALRRAQRVSERVARTGFEWPDIDSAFRKMEEEIAEFKRALQGNQAEKITEEMGDILLSLVNISRLSGANAEDALFKATDKFISRFNKMEQLLAEKDKNPADLDKEAMLDFWQKAKRQPEG